MGGGLLAAVLWYWLMHIIPVNEQREIKRWHWKRSLVSLKSQHVCHVAGRDVLATDLLNSSHQSHHSVTICKYCTWNDPSWISSICTGCFCGGKCMCVAGRNPSSGIRPSCRQHSATSCHRCTAHCKVQTMHEWYRQCMGGTDNVLQGTRNTWVRWRLAVSAPTSPLGRSLILFSLLSEFYVSGDFCSKDPRVLDSDCRKVRRTKGITHVISMTGRFAASFKMSPFWLCWVVLCSLQIHHIGDKSVLVGILYTAKQQ